MAVFDDPAFLALLTIVGEQQSEIAALKTILAVKGLVGPEELEALRDRTKSPGASFREEFLRILRDTQDFLNTPSSGGTKPQ